jgi:hypothetical protein
VQTVFGAGGWVQDQDVDQAAEFVDAQPGARPDLEVGEQAGDEPATARRGLIRMNPPRETIADQG